MTMLFLSGTKILQVCAHMGLSDSTVTPAALQTQQEGKGSVQSDPGLPRALFRQ